MVAAEAALATGDPAAALAHVKLAGARWPHSRLVWATFARCALGLQGFCTQGFHVSSCALPPRVGRLRQVRCSILGFRK